MELENIKFTVILNFLLVLSYRPYVKYEKLEWQSITNHYKGKKICQPFYFPRNMTPYTN